MRKAVLIMLGLGCAILFYHTVASAVKAFRSDWQLPLSSTQDQDQYRLVLIVQELETPFWDQIGAGALEQAELDGVSLEVWGSYNKNHVEFLRLFEIGIYSKVDGIIVQGLDTDEFKHLTKVKSAFYGIPIITVGYDVPKEESLRRTYVGSDQYQAGRIIAEQLIADMGTEGKVILLSDAEQNYYLEQRLMGIQDVLDHHAGIQTVYAETSDSWDQIIATTQDVMNQAPDADGFIAVSANLAGAMLQEIGRRSRIEPYHIYSFDEGPDSYSLLHEGKLDGMIQQDPAAMGRLSVRLMTEWLSGKTVPLDPEGYYTEIQMLKAMDAR